MNSLVFIYGPPGSGKSTVGKVLADNLGLDFIDLDQRIEAAANTPIPEIFSQQGEAAFRALESQALKNAVSEKSAVISLGGGTLLNNENRKLAEKYGKIIFLATKLENLTQRLSKDNNQRPLLKDNALAALLESRQEHYDSFGLRIGTDTMIPEQIVWEAVKRLGVFNITGMGSSYKVIVQSGGISKLSEFFDQARMRSPFCIISDTNVAQHYLGPIQQGLTRQGYASSGVIIPAGESNKSIETITEVWEEMVAAKMERGSTVLSLGGGMVNDMAGFAAATYMRGIPWATVPTSLLAMVDASIGGKTGANLPSGKNLIGSFYPPKLVLVDPQTLNTLPIEEQRSGMAEVVKHGVIEDVNLFNLCGQGLASVQQNWGKLIPRAIGVKVRVIVEDPYEQGIRATLNLGHTIGHGIELLSKYQLRHGEAIAIGMVAEARLSEKLGLAEAGLAEEITQTLLALELPTELPDTIDRQGLVQTLQMDKKRKGGLVKFALPIRIGEVRPGIEIPDLSNLIIEV